MSGFTVSHRIVKRRKEASPGRQKKREKGSRFWIKTVLKSMGVKMAAGSATSQAGPPARNREKKTFCAVLFYISPALTATIQYKYPLLLSMYDES
mmetsp:Transcript_168/g.407  ORF Transcript_168/g.407 Transcript_168/m.407 type:complete len:95 (-) Transcript_168:88-372(-)